MTNQQNADAQLALWQLQRRMNIAPEQRKLIEQDNDPSFYDWQFRLVEEQMDAR